MGLLTGPRRWWLFGAIGVSAGLIFGWDKLVLFGVAPILISLLPCLIMCGLGSSAQDLGCFTLDESILPVNVR